MKSLSIPMVAILMASALAAGCGRVDAGYVGVKVNLLGTEKGVQQQVVGVGRYYLGWNEELYTFPTFNQLHTYEEPFVFQTSDSMTIKAHVGVEYYVDANKVSQVFQTYRKGVNDITDVNLRQNISDALIKHASNMDINGLSAGGKATLLDAVTADLRAHLDSIGIRIVKLSWTSDLEYPPQVRESINAKIEATQRAALRENEVAQSKAEAQKAIEQARGEAQATLIKAKAEADAIKLRGDALHTNPEVLQLEAIHRWDGVAPTYIAGETATPPFIQFKH